MIRFNLSIFIIFSSFLLVAQERTKLEYERMKIIDIIEFTSGILKKTEKDKFNTLDYLNSLQNQIKNRKNIINNLNKQVQNINAEIKIKQTNYKLLVSRKKRIQDKFAKILQANYLQSIIKNKLLFLLSASNWEDYIDKKRYIKQFNKYTKKRLTQISKQETEIQNILTEINNNKQKIETLLAEEQNNIQKLKSESEKKNTILKELNKNERKLLAILKKQKSQRLKLNNSIEEIILKQLSGSNYTKNTINYTSNFFDNNKSKFILPIEQGYISSHFGKHRHPTIKDVFIYNNGIDIKSNPNAPVKVIFDGEVVGLRHITGFNWMMIVKHGDYYTVYSKLAYVDVSKGDKVVKGQKLGTIGENGQFHFEIWHQKTKLNPEKWLSF